MGFRPPHHTGVSSVLAGAAAPTPPQGMSTGRVHAGRSPGDLRQCPGRNILPAMSGVGEWGLYHLIIPAYHPFLRGLPPPHPRTGCPRAGCHAGMFLPLSRYDYPASRNGDGWESGVCTTSSYRRIIRSCGGCRPPHPRTGCPWAGCHAGMFLPLSGYDYPASRNGGGWESGVCTTSSYRRIIRSCGRCRPHTPAGDVHGQGVMLACSCHFPGMIMLLPVTGMGGRGFSPPRIG